MFPIMPRLCFIVAHHAPKLGRLTALLEYMTVLLEYFDLSISVAGHSPAFGYATEKETRC